MSMKKVLIAATSLLLLTACQTLQGVQRDIHSLTDQVHADPAAATTEDSKRTAALGSQPCPPVKILDDLKTMIEFPDLTRPSADSELARLQISDIRSVCETNDSELAVKLDITFDGALGPKAKVKETKQQSFSYPYFIAVTNLQGSVLA